MDLLKQTFESFNPNFEKLTKYTIRLGHREYETTNKDAAFVFTHAFGKRAGFNMSSAPYSGQAINSVVNTKQ